MKRYFYLLLFLATSIACQRTSYVSLSGTLANSSAKEVIISAAGYKKVIPVDEKGFFSDTLHLAQPGYYELRAGEYTQLYLKNGYKLHVTIDAQQFDESVTYTGKGAEINSYLTQKFLLTEKLTGNEKDFYSLSAGKFAEKNSEIKDKLLELLKKNPLSKAFVALEQKNIQYEYLLRLGNYKTYNQYYTATENVVLPAGFLGPLKTFTDYDNGEDYENFKSYRNLVQNNFSQYIEKEMKEDSVLLYYEAALLYLRTVKSEPIRKGLLNVIAYEINPANEKAQDVYYALFDLSTDKKFKKELTQKYEKIKQITKGNPSPAFKYENYKGGKTTLADLRGRYVYIDVWATWCAPCKAEIPHLKKLQADFKDENIVFVSISIDTPAAYETWKKMVSEEELQGVQLIADNNWDSTFVTEYAIDGIPRFILIDPDGNIVQADAPRPSSSEIRPLFNKVLKG